MKSVRNIRLILVTTPDLKTARTLARAALNERLVACANIIPGVESHYWWQEKLEKSREALVLFKTTWAKLPALEKLILAQHPYDTPEIAAIALDSSTPRYLQWLLANTR